MWTWGEAGELALYGVLTVFVILLLLTYMTKLSGIVISRIEKRRSQSKETGKKTGGHA